MIKWILIILIIFVTSPVLAFDKWSIQDKALEAAWQSIHLMDWGQTSMIARNSDRYYEMNPILGKHPSTQMVHGYMAVGALAHLGVTHILPKKWRPYWQGVTIGMSGICVVNNFNVGLGVRF